MVDLYDRKNDEQKWQASRAVFLRVMGDPVKFPDQEQLGQGFPSRFTSSIPSSSRDFPTDVSASFPAQPEVSQQISQKVSQLSHGFTQEDSLGDLLNSLTEKNRYFWIGNAF